jgi:hypothetical protein
MTGGVLMLLYTIMPYEAIFPPEGDMQLETKPIKGGFVCLLNTPEGKTVSRLISTDPKMYLKGPNPGDKYISGQ